MINWKKLLDDNTLGRDMMSEFAKGEASMSEVSRVLARTSMAGEFRRLVRSSGTNKARNLTRKALNRRNKISVTTTV